MRRFSFLIVIGAVLCSGVPCSAFEFEFPWLEAPSSFQITLSSVFEYHDDNFNRYRDDDGYSDLKNRLNLKLSVDRFSLSGRIDTNTFIHAPLPDRNQYNPYYLDRYAPEKVTAAYQGPQLKVVAGDFYATIGRGLALNIRKTDQIGEDNTLLGGMVTWNTGSVEWIALSGLTNLSNLDLFEKTLPDPYDSVSAAAIQWRPGGGIRLGLHGVGYVFDPLKRNEKAQLEAVVPRYTTIAGASVEALGLPGQLDLYAEVNWLARQARAFASTDDPPPDLTHGWGAYLSLSASLGDWNLSLEAKSLDDFYARTVTWEADGRYSSQTIDYLLPPTLEAPDMEIHNTWNLTGGRLRVDFRPGGSDTLLFASYAGFVAQDFHDAGNRWIYNLRLGAEQDFPKTGRARLAVGLREETPLYAGGATYHLLYIEGLCKVPLASRHSLDLHGSVWFLHELLGSFPVDSLRGDWTLEYSWSPWLAVGILFGFDTAPSQGETPYNFDVFYRVDPGAPLQRQLFLAGSLSLDLWGNALVRLLAGQMRGGLLCVGGVCRELPPFAGLRVELTLRF